MCVGTSGGHQQSKNAQVVDGCPRLRHHGPTHQRTSNAVADALSRRSQEDDVVSVARFIGAIIPIGYEPREIAIMQHADEEIRQIVLTAQEIGDRPIVNAGEYFLDKGILYRHNNMPGRKHLLVVPSIIRQSLVREYHTTPAGGHHGRDSLRQKGERKLASCSHCNPLDILLINWE